MDIKEKIEEIVETLKGDPKLLEKFKADPVETLKDVTGLDLPEDQIKPVVAGIKAKLGAGDISDALGKLGKLF